MKKAEYRQKNEEKQPVQNNESCQLIFSNGTQDLAVTFILFLRLNPIVNEAATQVNGDAYVQPQSADESKKVVVIALSNTCSQPHTVMVHLKHTIVTNVAVNASWRSKNQTCLAEFELSHCASSRVELVVEDTAKHVCFGVLFCDSVLAIAPHSRWNDSGVA